MRQRARRPARVLGVMVVAMPRFPADIEYSEVGEGPKLLLLPGSFGTGSEWKAVTERLIRRYRPVTTSSIASGVAAVVRADCVTLGPLLAGAAVNFFHRA